MSCKWFYRVKHGGQMVARKDWSEKDAREHAKHAVKAGASKACVERAPAYHRSLFRAKWRELACYRRK